MKRIHLFISGIVHDVNFRYYTKQKAEELGLAGFVRNTETRVEVVAEGEPEKIQQLVDWCKKGPLRARVEKVKLQEESFRGEFKRFEIQ